ncbi:hypothetical protein ENC19_10665 [Verrucosispora sp. CWR15]|uniref:Uncharacterized protein n=1 Tax=Verrucosispora sioxanthis TaxID=2499994 RepID=A0A6M1L4C9_9ACTN|nr:hypothetical protein [Verrucosispora sioxanthis]NEE63980.1 hypothetical protein [Verrucosispora sioxanthis]NGM13090.1 hypothetical protein [Verrucosispora sioxanthis]
MGTEVIVGQPRSRAWWRINRVELALARAVACDWGGGADLLTEPATPPSRHPPVLVARDVVATVVAAGQGDHATAARFGRRAERRAATADLPYEIGLAGSPEPSPRTGWRIRTGRRCWPSTRRPAS